MNIPKENESLYRTMHNTSPAYRENNWGLDTLPQWIDKLKKPASILEIGCGNGKLCNLLSDMGYDVTGLDLIESNYDRKKYKFIKHDIELGLLPFKDNEFDYCVSFDVLEHLPEKWIEQFIFDTARVSREIVVTAACYGEAPLHLTVKPVEWWIEKFNRICDGLEVKTIHIYTSANGNQRILFHGKKGAGK
jgi:SAM-dependent methyltransferase